MKIKKIDYFIQFIIYKYLSYNIITKNQIILIDIAYKC
jgi:hypothetical protein